LRLKSQNSTLKTAFGREGIVRAFDYHKPQSIQEALGLMGTLEDARFVAGGTDVMVLYRQKKIAPRNLVSLRSIRELTTIGRDDGLWIGSGVTHSDIVKDVFIKRHYAALHDATSTIGSRQIRNVATVGGNICNAAPSADTGCPLLVLDAKVSIVGKKGEREVDIDSFFLGPNKTVLDKGELVKGFRMPRFDENSGSAYIKHTRRQAMDLPILGIAVRVVISVGKSEARCKDVLCIDGTTSEVLARLQQEDLRCEDVRIAMGVVAPRPIRAKKAEEAMKGKMVSEKLLGEVGEIAASEATPRDSIRGEAWYRTEMVKVLTRRAILRSIERVIRPDDTLYPERLW
jgi:CO/xanthine dehydrogenase FAD-binding subunit